MRFTPDLATDRLVFRLWPNAPRTAGAGARLDVLDVNVDGRAAPAAPAAEDATILVVQPGRNLAPRRPVDARVAWRLRLPAAVEDRVSRTGDAIRLGSFFPILPWEPGVGWATEPPTSGFAEASTAPVADFTAVVTAPAGLEVLATGQAEAGGRWTAVGVPDFAVAVGRFSRASGTAHVPDPVAVTVAVHAGVPESPAAYLPRVVRSLEELSRRYGPYPWPAYTLSVTPHLDGGIEYPMHALQGPGTGGRTTTHEVAHMWFYGLVGSDQGRDPWLDEGLASWAEARLEGTLGSFLARRIPPAGRGRLGEPMTYWEPRPEAYYRSVYVQGVQALAALGQPDLVDCALRLYVARAAYRIARPRHLVDAARTVFPGAAETLARFGVRA